MFSTPCQNSGELSWRAYKFPAKMIGNTNEFYLFTVVRVYYFHTVQIETPWNYANTWNNMTPIWKQLEKTRDD